MAAKRIVLLLLCLHSTTALKLPVLYDESLRPNTGAVADVVNVSMQVLAIREVDENEQAITLDFLLKTFWVDPRLSGLVERETIFINKIPLVWTPDLFIVNSVNTKYPEINSRSIKLGSDGAVSQTERISAKISCRMSFAKFPFEKHVCHVEIKSFAYSRIHLYPVWNGMISEEVAMYNPEFRFSSFEQYSRKSLTQSGEFVSLLVDVSIYRCSTRYIMRAILPSIILAMFSYYTFFLRQKQENESTNQITTLVASTTISPSLSLIRVGINSLMLSLLIFISQMNYLKSPQAAAFTALDLWMSLIGIVICIALFKSIYTYVKHLEKSFSEEKEDDQQEALTDKIDRILTIGIPITFFVFLVIYLAAYLS